jgi:ATP-dependent helicase/nuclease subunit A
MPDTAKWTERQLDAINARNTAVIVSAAAGSGKTSVLVERLLRILSDSENPTPADRIIVVTFTNDAAAQMKQRLSEAIQNKLEADPHNSWLASQQALIPSAKISTIHSFCFDMIRENVQTLDISSGFRVLDETEEGIIVKKAIENIFERMYTEKPELMNELCDFTSPGVRSDTYLEETILKIYRFVMSLPFPEDRLNEFTEKYGTPFDEKSDPLGAEYSRYISDTLRSLSDSINAYAKLFEKCGDEKNAQLAQNEHESLLSLAENTANESLPWNKRFDLSGISWATLARVKLEKGSPEFEIREKAKKSRDKCKAKFKKISSDSIFTESDINDDYKFSHEIMKKLSFLVKELIAEIARLKSEKNALGFSDAEQLAVKLLCKKDSSGNIVKTKLASELSEYYRLIMIDEFQDANNTQNLIFRMLSHNGTADINGDNLFVVGDVKQSIYRFRLANPRNFMNVLESADSYSTDYKGKNAAILLNRNFRSSPDVINYVNDVFETVMSRDVGEIDYTDSEKLEAGAVYPDEDRSTEFIFAECPNSADDTKESEDESLSDEQAEARCAALKISSMLGVRTVSDKGTLRPCESRDFCILLRDKARGQLYADELARVGIKASCEETAGYLRSREIAVLVNLLTVIDNPMQDIPLVSVLMSPMFMLTAEECAELRLLSESRHDHIYKCVLKALETPDTVPFSGKLIRFKDIFGKLRICAASQSLERLINTVYDSTDFLSSVQAYADGEQKKANLRLLLEYAKSYEENSSGGLTGFIRYLNNITESGKDFVRASVVSPADNVVSIKTIHKSKGLEYPFVFLCGTSKKFNLMDVTDSLQLNLNYGIAFKIRKRKELKCYDSFPRFALSCKAKRETVSEEMRLLYVALTRAREQLFITVPDNNKTSELISEMCSSLAASGGKALSAAKDADCMLDWLLAALLTHPAGKKALAEKYGSEISEIINDMSTRESKARIKIRSLSAESDAAEEKTLTRPEPDKASVEKLLKEFSYTYESPLPKIPAKLTITEIAKSESEDIFLRRPDFSADFSRLTPAEIGTAMHTFMQYADYSLAENEPMAQAEILVRKGLLSESEKNSLQYDKLRDFFTSDLYLRMKKSPKIQREKKFLIEISQLGLDDELGLEYNNTNGMLQGIADCIFEESGGLVLVDYKTDRVKDENVLAERYRRQLLLYSIALEKIMGTCFTNAYLYSFCLGKEIEIPIK